MKHWLPSPPLSFALFLVWLLLNQSLHAATVLIAMLLAVIVPLLTRGLRPATVRMRRPTVALRLTGCVLLDMVRSAVTLTRLLLTRRSEHIASRFVHVPLDLRDPNALAVLAIIVALTPGTAWGELALDRSTLLLHAFHVTDEGEAAFIVLIKQRYERPLMEIFES